MNKNIVFIFSVLPNYKIDFLKLLNQRLELIGQKLIVITGTNVGNKVIEGAHTKQDFKIISNNTVGIKVLGYHVEWQKNMITEIKKCDPGKVVLVFRPGKLNDYLLMLYLLWKKIPFLMWRCGYKRFGLSSIKSKIRTQIKVFFEKKSSAYITYGSYYASELKKIGYPEDKIFIAQNTINVEEIIQRQKNTNYKRTYHSIKFLFVGALIPHKNLEKAIRACNILSGKGLEFEFDIVGSGEEHNRLDKLITELDLKEIVHLHGAKYEDEVIPFFQSANVFILPGTGGLALNEAMAYSLPVISAPADGTALDLIDEGENGFLLELNYDIVKLADRMEYFLKSNEETIKKMEIKSREIIEGRASLKNMVDSFFEGINSINTRIN